MKVLIALPVEHKFYRSIDDVIRGDAPVNGTDGSFIRLAGLLAEAGVDVCLSAAFEFSSCHFQSLKHSDVKAEELRPTIYLFGCRQRRASKSLGNRTAGKLLAARFAD